MITEKIKKRKKRKTVRIILLLLVLFVIASPLLIYGLMKTGLINFINGEITVSINGEDYIVEDLQCSYISTGDGISEKVIVKEKTDRIKFKNTGNKYGVYEYKFSVSNEEVTVYPQITVFKTNWRYRYKVDIEVELFQEEDNQKWDAKVTVYINDRAPQTQYFYDVEDEVIVFDTGV